MSGFCKSISGDQRAQTICDYLVEKYGCSKSDLDVGVPGVVRPEGGDAYLKPGVPDGAVEAAEVYAKAMEVARSEEEDNWEAVGTDYFGTDYSFHSPDLEFFAKEADFRIPGMFDDLEESDKAEWIFPRVKMKVEMMKGQTRLAKLDVGTPKYQRSLALKIFKFIKKPSDRGGMGIAFDESPSNPQRSLVEVMAAREATCIEFVNLYIAIARHAGLKARPVEVYTDEDGYFIDHMKVAVELSDGSAVFMGLHDGVGLDPDERWSFISMNDLAAHDYNARSMLDCPAHGEDGSIECKGEYLELSLSLSPTHYMALRNKALWYYYQDDLQSAIEYLSKSKDAYPEYPDTRYDLSKIHEELGNLAEAEKECEAYKALSGSDSCD